ncbi:glycosyltransferase family 2 protein [Paenirhodobacter populi]|uniref:Glycosyltransferase family 2 protein n=1 Tax=Paenirhodobacter populi TaxID=2306993 RepID=A0A443JBV5_9RHOB|nr:glycosyltransferase family 2 protein [Sinirhodobacter populi]RWR18039.1 glycosyltransferase family 2 protein [Sinirhodobacter populi]
MTAENKSGIAVIVVNYGTADLSIAAVESVLARQHGGHPVEVHLVDNASPGDDAARFARAHDEKGWGGRVTLWLEGTNHGFGRGNNVVIYALMQRPRESGAAPDYVFLLNPDAMLENEALAILADRLDADPGAGAAGAGIALPSGKPVTAAFRFPSATSEFVQAVAFGPVARVFANRIVALPPDHPDGPVDWVAGAAVMFRMSVLRQLNGFDPDFFLYYEEVELMHRIRQAGHEILYVPGARVLHAEGAATDQKSHRPERRPRPSYWYRSWMLYYLKTAGRGGAIAAGAAWIAGALINLPLSALRGRGPSMPLNFLRDFPRQVMVPLLTGKTDG